MVEKYCYNIFLMTFFGGEENVKAREDKRMMKFEFEFFPNCPLGHVLKKSAR